MGRTRDALLRVVAAAFTAAALLAAAITALWVQLARPAQAVAPAAATPTPTPTPLTAPQSSGRAWTAFVADYAEPLAPVLAFVLAGWLALFVVARLIVEFTPLADLSSSRVSGRAAATLGTVLVGGVPPLAVTAGIATADATLPFRYTLWAFIAALGAVGAITLAAWLGARPRLRIEVLQSGTADSLKTIDASRIGAALGALSSSTTTELVVPQGTAADIKDTLTELSSAPWVAAIQKIVLFLVGATPWVVRADIKDARHASLTITRNGRTVAARPVRTDSPDLSALDELPRSYTPERVLTVFLAAEIVMALRERYPDDLDADLFGARDAAGAALQYVAVGYYGGGTHDEAAVSLLRSALDRDPFNELARYSLDYIRHRTASTAEALIAFGSRLDRAIEQRRARVGDRPDLLLVSMAGARITAARNLAATIVAATPAATRESARQAVVRAQGLLSDRPRWTARRTDSIEADVRERLDRMTAIVLAEAESWVRSPRDWAPDDSHAPSVERMRRDPVVRADAYLAYSLACLLLRWRGHPWDDDVRDLLETGRAGSPLYAAFVGRDPELTTAPAWPAVQRWLREGDAVAAAAAAAATRAERATRRAARRKGRQLAAESITESITRLRFF